MRATEDLCAYQIKGSVTTSDGQPLSSVIVAADHHGSDSSTMNRVALDGSFTLLAPTPGKYRLSLDLNDDCGPYYFPTWATVANFARSLITVGSTDVNDIFIEVPEGLCMWQISGRIITPDGLPLANARIDVCRRIDALCEHQNQTTNPDGSFTIIAPDDGAYELHFSLERGCKVYVNGDGLTTRHWEYSDVRVEGQDVHLGLLQVPAGACRQITGRITAPDETPYANTNIAVCRWTDVDCEYHSHAETDDDGSFTIVVPADSSYSLSAWLYSPPLWTVGRDYYFSSDGFTADPEERPIVRVEGDDVHLGTLQVPVG